MWLETDLPRRFASRLPPIDGPVAEIWGAMAGQARLAGVALAIYRRAGCGNGDTP